jgi:hypothetical protein
MGWTAVGVMILASVFFLVVVVVSALEGWRWRRK